MKAARVISLMYHDINGQGAKSSDFTSNDLEAKYIISYEKFEKQIEKLSFLAIPKYIINNSMELKENEKDNPVLITFDDGKACIVAAAGVLESYGFRGYFFVIASKVGSSGYASNEEILSLRLRGHIIGTHSLTHPKKISELEYKDILHEWQESTRILSSILGEKIKVAAVPGGFCSNNVIRAAAECGISMLFTSEPVTFIKHYGNISVLGRYNIYSTDKYSTLTDLAMSKGFERQKRFLTWNIKKLIKKVLGKYFIPFKRLLANNK